MKTSEREAGERGYWLLKTEPKAFSFDRLWSSKAHKAPWDGVRNHQARNLLRDSMKEGDGVLVYHSSCVPTGVVGFAVVASPARPDPSQFDPRSPRFDPGSKDSDPRWWMVDVRATLRAPRIVTLAELRAAPGLARMELLRKGNRLSVQPVREEEWRAVLALAGILEPDPGR
jgi:predicted RNA-binding protein with PUA-like domain